MSPNSRISVLVVDDEAMVGQSVSGQLERLGFQVAGCAYDAREAVQQVLQLRPTVVIMDMKMPDPETGQEDPEAGLKATREIQKRIPTAVVLLTAFESPALVEKASAAGIGAYLLKPAKDNDLERAIAIAIARFRDLHRLWAANNELRREVQERRRAQEALQRSEGRFRALAECAPMGVFLVDGEARFTYLSPQWSRITGYSSAEAASLHPFDLARPEDRPAAREAMKRSFSGAQPFVHVHRILRKDGVQRWVRMHLAPLLGPDGSRTGFMGLLDDITERKQARELREQAQRRESLGLLAGALAHDLNNLLTGIQGHLELCRLPGRPEADLSRHLDGIQDSVLRAGELARQLLALSGHGHFTTERLDLDPLVEATLQALGRERPVLPPVEVRSPELLAVEGYGPQLQQVLHNLLVNACEALGNGPGGVTIRTRRLRLDAREAAHLLSDEEAEGGDYAALEVSDEGCGMDAETVSRIFDPFFSTKFVGRGLGLTTALGILKAHGGALRVESEPGKGSTFTMLLPALPASAAAPAQPPSPGPSAAPAEPGLILLVDDEPILRESVAELLQSLGHQVIEAVDGLDALEQFRAHHERIALVLMDLTMPRMDGREAFTAMRELQPDVKVILSSGYTEQDATRHLIGSGLAAFLQKPYRFKDLEEVLARVLGKG